MARHAGSHRSAAFPRVTGRQRAAREALAREALPYVNARVAESPAEELFATVAHQGHPMHAAMPAGSQLLPSGARVYVGTRAGAFLAAVRTGFVDAAMFTSLDTEPGCTWCLVFLPDAQPFATLLSPADPLGFDGGTFPSPGGRA